MSIEFRSDRSTDASRNRHSPSVDDAATAGPAAGGRPGRRIGLIASLGAAALLVVVGGAGLGCGSDPSDLAAPTGLEAMLVQGGVHLSWEDRSTGEEAFIVMRSESQGDFAEIGRVGENVTSFHDVSVHSGGMYTYMVHATAAGVTSAPSNEASVAVP